MIESGNGDLDTTPRFFKQQDAFSHNNTNRIKTSQVLKNPIPTICKEEKPIFINYKPKSKKLFKTFDQINDKKDSIQFISEIADNYKFMENFRNKELIDCAFKVEKNNMNNSPDIKEYIQNTNSTADFKNFYQTVSNLKIKNFIPPVPNSNFGKKAKGINKENYPKSQNNIFPKSKVLKNKEKKEKRRISTAPLQKEKRYFSRNEENNKNFCSNLEMRFESNINIDLKKRKIEEENKEDYSDVELEESGYEFSDRQTKFFKKYLRYIDFIKKKRTLSPKKIPIMPPVPVNNSNYKEFEKDKRFNKIDISTFDIDIIEFRNAVAKSAEVLINNLYKEKDIEKVKTKIFKEIGENKIFERILDKVFRKVIYVSDKNMDICEDYVLNLIHDEIGQLSEKNSTKKTEEVSLVKKQNLEVGNKLPIITNRRPCTSAFTNIGVVDNIYPIRNVKIDLKQALSPIGENLLESKTINSKHNRNNNFSGKSRSDFYENYKNYYDNISDGFFSCKNDSNSNNFYGNISGLKKDEKKISFRTSKSLNTTFDSKFKMKKEEIKAIRRFYRRNKKVLKRFRYIFKRTLSAKENFRRLRNINKKHNMIDKKEINKINNEIRVVKNNEYKSAKNLEKIQKKINEEKLAKEKKEEELANKKEDSFHNNVINTINSDIDCTKFIRPNSKIINNDSNINLDNEKEKDKKDEINIFNISNSSSKKNNKLNNEDISMLDFKNKEENKGNNESNSTIIEVNNAKINSSISSKEKNAKKISNLKILNVNNNPQNSKKLIPANNNNNQQKKEIKKKVNVNTNLEKKGKKKTDAKLGSKKKEKEKENEENKNNENEKDKDGKYIPFVKRDSKTKVSYSPGKNKMINSIILEKDENDEENLSPTKKFDLSDLNINSEEGSVSNNKVNKISRGTFKKDYNAEIDAVIILPIFLIY